MKNLSHQTNYVSIHNGWTIRATNQPDKLILFGFISIKIYFLLFFSLHLHILKFRQLWVGQSKLPQLVTATRSRR